MKTEDIQGYSELSPSQKEKAKIWVALNQLTIEGDEILGFSTIGDTAYINYRDQFSYFQSRIT
jgi:hypothetical protein